jgi:very-short-patch-repair endonuclease
MDELGPFPLTPRNEKSPVRAARVAGAQWGVIATKQLQDCGIHRSTVGRWRGGGRLHLIHPRVYSLGHPWIPVEGQMVAALLAVGPEAVLSHATAAWWWGLIDRQPDPVEVSIPHRSKYRGAIRVNRTRHLERTRHRRFPITPVARTLVDYAAHASLSEVRRALAEADYRQLFDRTHLEAALIRGRPGAATLRNAMRTHEPRLAHTRSAPERRFLTLCARAGLPIPEVNVRIGRMTVDALWRPERLVVEVDTYATHGSPARMERDRRRELHLRAAGYTVVRYTDVQIDGQPELVAIDLRAQIARSA